MVLVGCKIGGKQINRKPSDLKNKSGFSFCSLRCARKYGATLTPPRERDPLARRFLARRLRKRVTDRVYRVSKDHGPLNPIAREAWDRRVLAREIHEYPLPLDKQTAGVETVKAHL